MTTTNPERAFYESSDIRAETLTVLDVMLHEGQWRSVDNLHTAHTSAEPGGIHELTDTELALISAYTASDDYVVAELRIASPGAPIGHTLVPLRRYDLVTVQTEAGTLS